MKNKMENKIQQEKLPPFRNIFGKFCLAIMENGAQVLDWVGVGPQSQKNRIQKQSEENFKTTQNSNSDMKS